MVDVSNCAPFLRFTTTNALRTVYLSGVVIVDLSMAESGGDCENLFQLLCWKKCVRYAVLQSRAVTLDVTLGREMACGPIAGIEIDGTNVSGRGNDDPMIPRLLSGQMFIHGRGESGGKRTARRVKYGIGRA